MEHASAFVVAVFILFAISIAVSVAVGVQNRRGFAQLGREFTAVKVAVSGAVAAQIEELKLSRAVIDAIANTRTPVAVAAAAKQALETPGAAVAAPPASVPHQAPPTVQQVVAVGTQTVREGRRAVAERLDAGHQAARPELFAPGPTPVPPSTKDLGPAREVPSAEVPQRAGSTTQKPSREGRQEGTQRPILREALLGRAGAPPRRQTPALAPLPAPVPPPVRSASPASGATSRSTGYSVVTPRPPKTPAPPLGAQDDDSVDPPRTIPPVSDAIASAGPPTAVEFEMDRPSEATLVFTPSGGSSTGGAASGRLKIPFPEIAGAPRPAGAPRFPETLPSFQAVRPPGATDASSPEPDADADEPAPRRAGAFRPFVPGSDPKAS